MIALKGVGFFLCSIVALIAAPFTHAQIAIEIDRGRDNPRRIAIVLFAETEEVSARERISDIVGRDLARSGQFSPLSVTHMLSLPQSQDEVFFRDWHISRVDYLVIGSLELTPEGELQANWTLFDVLGERILWHGLVTGARSAHRDIAHQISDTIYESITGVEGAFSTKLLYVLVQDAGTDDVNYRLEMADADGMRSVTLLESSEPILSPSFSPMLLQSSSYGSTAAGPASISKISIRARGVGWPGSRGSILLRIFRPMGSNSHSLSRVTAVQRFTRSTFRHPRATQPCCASQGILPSTRNLTGWPMDPGSYLHLIAAAVRKFIATTSPPA